MKRSPAMANSRFQKAFGVSCRTLQSDSRQTPPHTRVKLSLASAGAVGYSQLGNVGTPVPESIKPPVAPSPAAGSGRIHQHRYSSLVYCSERSLYSVSPSLHYDGLDSRLIESTRHGDMPNFTKLGRFSVQRVQRCHRQYNTGQGY